MGAQMLTTWVRGLLSPKGSEDADLEYEKYFERFQQILEVEQGAINLRRRALGRLDLPWRQLNKKEKGGAQRPMYDSTGLALSGGGIRSAAFCLGALQSLAVTGVAGAAPGTRSLFDQVDYLSTVSGGGYVGSAVTAAMASPTATSQKFPFVEFGRFDDEPSVGHLRDFSNYLFPRGSSSLADMISVVLRGLATNVVFILAGILFFAMLTVLAYPDFVQVQAHGSFLPRLAAGDLQWLGILTGLAERVGRSGPFLLTEVLLAIFGLYLIVWAILRSRPALDFGAVTDGLFSDVRGVFVRGGRLFVFAVAVAAFFDVQPFALHGFQWIATHSIRQAAEYFAMVTAPFAGIVALFSNRLSEFLKANSFKTGAGALTKRILAHALVFAAAAVLPILLWLAYLWVSAAGMPHSGVFLPGCSGKGCWLWNPYMHGPLQSYFWLWLFFFLTTLLFAPNANSLHQPYRDKLSKAFLFNPANRATQGRDSGDLLPRGHIELNELAPATGGPYHLINAAINLQGSVQANRRGRNASFFLFSPKFVGSEVTDFAPIELVQKADPHIDLGTAMAISGAAVSSNMGSSSVRALSPTLALLNIRLGYWMKNPKHIISSDGGERITLWTRLKGLFKTYLFNEMFGQLDENQPLVYLTDGGHIENLGLYSLLKRHCRLIIVVDGEADPLLTFHALSICERYARIDLGVRLDVPWQQIADVGNAATVLAKDGKPIPTTGGPHCTVGSILYPGGEHGVLLYVKASLTGDEPDYVVDYKMRNPTFPHESTGDQFFSEEQFEAYRALGFHALDGFLNDKRAFTSCGIVKTAAVNAGLGVPDYVKSLMV
jgi:hypothetical protein